VLELGSFVGGRIGSGGQCVFWVDSWQCRGGSNVRGGNNVLWGSNVGWGVDVGWGSSNVSWGSNVGWGSNVVVGINVCRTRLNWFEGVERFDSSGLRSKT
jgi:hypothetical protein